MCEVLESQRLFNAATTAATLKDSINSGQLLLAAAHVFFFSPSFLDHKEKKTRVFLETLRLNHDGTAVILQVSVFSDAPEAGGGKKAITTKPLACWKRTSTEPHVSLRGLFFLPLPSTGGTETGGFFLLLLFLLSDQWMYDWGCHRRLCSLSFHRLLPPTHTHTPSRPPLPPPLPSHSSSSSPKGTLTDNESRNAGTAGTQGGFN